MRKPLVPWIATAFVIAFVAGPANAARPLPATSLTWSPTTGPGAFDYGTVQVGQGSSQAFTLMNSGSKTTALQIALSGAGFSKGADGCSGKILAQNQSCLVTVDFAPLAAGAAGGTLTATWSRSKSAALSLAGTGQGLVCTVSGISIVASQFGGVQTQLKRAADFELAANLDSSGCDANYASLWSYSWTIKKGSEDATAVPSDWVGSDGPVLTVPALTLEKYATNLNAYVFTVTATPPAGDPNSQQTAPYDTKILGTQPLAGGFVPQYPDQPFIELICCPTLEFRGFATPYPTIDYDNPSDPHLDIIWHPYAQSGQPTPDVVYGTGDEWYVGWITFQEGFYSVSLEVCPNDELESAPAEFKTTCGGAQETPPPAPPGIFQGSYEDNTAWDVLIDPPDA